MKIAFLYAGQGSQFEGMGKDLYEKQDVFAKTFDNIDEKIKELCFNADLETLSQTTNTQPCMVAFAIAITDVLKEKGIVPSITAGLSLGEYSALYTAGVLTKEQAISLVTFRSKQMEQASKGLDCSMVAILGLSKEDVENACKQAQSEGIVQIANLNCPLQIVIAGEKNAVNKACQMSKELGAKRTIELKVSGPFHTSFMKPAGDALKEKFLSEKFSNMEIPVVFNAIGRAKQDNENIAKLLEKQVQSSVFFEDSIKYMIENGVDTFVEIGGGKALSGFVKKISKDVKTYAIYNNDTLLDALESLKGE